MILTAHFSSGNYSMFCFDYGSRTLTADFVKCIKDDFVKKKVERYK